VRSSRKSETSSSLRKKGATPNIFEYEDYRVFLQDVYRYLKKENSKFSFRSFGREAGFASPNFLKLVMDGQRNLTVNSIQKLIRTLKLYRQEAEFFESLVLFNQAKDSHEKNEFYERMTRSRRYKKIKALERDQFQFYSHWYFSAIREIVNLPGFRNDPVWIASLLGPSVTSKMVEQAIELLLKLHLLEEDSQGNLSQADTTITSGPEVRSLAVKNYHREMLALASESLDRVPPLERDISAVTLGVPLALMPKLKEKIDQFRKELLATIGSTSLPPNRVYQLNVTLFPLTQEAESE